MAQCGEEIEKWLKFGDKFITRFEAKGRGIKRDELCPVCNERPKGKSRGTCQPCRYKRSGYNTWDKEKRQEFNALQREGSKRRYWAQKLEVINALGGKCECCGETTIQFLEIDHIDNDGKISREEFSFWTERKQILKGTCPFKLQVLCANCHRAKTSSVECPHKAT
jgi:hypothetical protein